MAIPPFDYGDESSASFQPSLEGSSSSSFYESSSSSAAYDTSSESSSSRTSDVQRRILCKNDECPRIFTTLNAMRIHYTRMHAKKIYDCTHCDKQFALRGDLADHMRKTIGKRTCRLCDFVGNNTFALTKHLTQFHPNDKYECHLCDRQFIRLDTLKCHLRVHKKRDQSSTEPAAEAVARKVKILCGGVEIVRKAAALPQDENSFDSEEIDAPIEIDNLFK